MSKGWVAGLLIALVASAGAALAEEEAEPFFAGTAYSDKVATPESLLGFPLGSRAARPAEIERCLKAWAAASSRAALIEIGRSVEGRSLWNLVVSSAANLDRLKKIQEGWARISDPRELAPAEGDSLTASLPAVAYLGFSIHGDETSGADAALALAYHLIAGDSPEIDRLLDNLVIVLDPVLNPDGRERFLSQLAEVSAGRLDRDDQSLRHRGFWPEGRGNHFLFDLNRDWLFATQPETRARIEAIRRWNPLLVIDAHEMDAQESFLFYPPRPPINPYMPPEVQRWWEVFGREQAAAFDQKGWSYYTGEWSEEWYPGYTNSWASYRGAVGILYEQAGIGQGEVVRGGGDVLAYRDTVARPATGALASLSTLAENRKKIARDYLALRRRAVAAEGPFAGRYWAVLGDGSDRLQRLGELLRLHGLAVFSAPSAMTVENAGNALGELRPTISLPAGTLLIPARQPEAHLAGALLDFDLKLDNAVLARERQEVMRHGRSLLYDVSAWSLPLLFDLETWLVPGELPAKLKPFESASAAKVEARLDGAVALVAGGQDDASLSLALRWLERGLAVRWADRSFELSGKKFARGSLLVARSDQRRFAGDALAVARDEAARQGLAVEAVTTGLGAGELPDLGGQHFHLLELPRVALVSRGGAEPTSVGELWYLLDRQLELTHSQLDESQLRLADLRRYNVVILPDRAGEPLPSGLAESLGRWVEEGGTLIALGQAATELARDGGPSAVRELGDVAGEVGAYRLSLLREWMTETGRVSPDEVWSRSPALSWADPWEELPLPGPDDRADWLRREEWQRPFLPQGALLAARLDEEHWLSAGCHAPLPVMVGAMPVLMAKEPIEAVVRLGYVPPPVVEADGFSALGWGVVPLGRPFYLRMAGLLWPEAGQLLANAAYLTRESRGNGQILLFAASPLFRGGAAGTARLLANAVVLGPGLGSRPRLLP